MDGTNPPKGIPHPVILPQKQTVSLASHLSPRIKIGGMLAEIMAYGPGNGDPKLNQY